MKNYICFDYARGARIGHQVDNYFSSLLICDFYDLEMIYNPFSHASAQFENVLLFNQMHKLHYYNNKPNLTEIELNNFENILSDKTYSKIYKLDLNKNDVIFSTLLKQIPRKKILNFYKEHKIKLNQIYRTKNPYTTKNNLIIHIRRGDAINIESRYLDINYFHKTLDSILKLSNVKYNIYITSESNLEDIGKLKEYNPILLIDKSDVDAFYYMVNADIIIGSPSGFSHLAYILGDGDYYRSPKDWFLYDTDVKSIL